MFLDINICSQLIENYVSLDQNRFLKIKIMSLGIETCFFDETSLFVALIFGAFDIISAF